MAQPPAQPSMAQALEAAWQRSQEAAEAGAQTRRAEAEKTVAASWLAAAPALELAQREGRRQADGRETEVGLALPLWRPGQRSAANQAAQAESDWAEAAALAARLRLAGQLREAAGSLHALEAEARLSGLQRELLQRLAEDVARRVKAGDLAPADEMAARAEWLEAQSLEAEARQKLQAQRAHWLLLTGLREAPATEGDARSEAEIEAHPERRLSSQLLERSRRQLALLQAQRGEPPELALGLRQERPGLGAPAQHSVTVGLRLPFGSATHSAPKLAAALAEQDLALAAAERSRARLATELAVARSQALANEAQAALAAQRAALLRERASLIEKSFQAGESPLPELLRALNAAAQAEAAEARQQAALSLARARLQQAFGVLP